MKTNISTQETKPGIYTKLAAPPLTVKATVEAVGNGQLELRLSNGSMVSLPATRDEERAFAALLYSEVTIMVTAESVKP